MSVLNAFAAARLEVALAKLDEVIDYLDGAVDRIPREMVLRTRGELVAMKQLCELQADLERAPTERPAPALRVIK